MPIKSGVLRNFGALGYRPPNNQPGGIPVDEEMLAFMYEVRDTARQFGLCPDANLIFPAINMIRLYLDEHYVFLLSVLDNLDCWAITLYGVGYVRDTLTVFKTEDPQPTIKLWLNEIAAQVHKECNEHT